MFYIGVDLGTSSVKLLLMEGSGEIVKTISREYPLEFPCPGWSQQDPEDWWRETKAGIRELTEDMDRSQIAGISFGGQMHGLVILDKDDQVIRPAILWNDGRTQKQTDYLNQEIGKEKLSAYTGNIAFAGFTAPKLIWIKENEPENFARIKKIMLPKDYIAYMLTGIHSTDYSDASGTLFLDVKNRRWSKEMMEICSIEEWQLPKLYESFAATGVLKPDVARELGLPKTCIVAAGAGDNAAAAVGTGTVGEGRCNISLGTSGTVFLSSRRFLLDPHNALHAFAHADGHFHQMGCILSAASCNKWWMEDIIGTRDYGREQEKIFKLGENHVYFLPYLMGERSPHNDPAARGTFTGLTMDTTRADMTQAVLEGVVFAIRDSLEAARRQGLVISEATICGGGAKSLLWKNMAADILNIRINELQSEEGPSLGAAMLAAVACGEYASVEEAAARIVKTARAIDPEKSLAEKYEERYQTFRKIYPALKPVFEKM